MQTFIRTIRTDARIPSAKNYATLFFLCYLLTLLRCLWR